MARRTDVLKRVAAPIGVVTGRADDAAGGQMQLDVEAEIRTIRAQVMAGDTDDAVTRSDRVVSVHAVTAALAQIYGIAAVRQDHALHMIIS